MYDKLKDEVYKEFDKSKNYNAILSKMNGEGSIKNVKVKLILGTMCVVVVALFGVKIIRDFDYTISIDYVTDEQKWERKEVYYDSSKMETSMEVATVPHWDEMSINQQFNFVTYNEKSYDSKNAEISEVNIGKEIGTALLTGRDTYTNEVHTINANVYDIKNISSECALALQFEDTSEYYVYINAYYKPETLGDLIEDLNLRENLSFGTIIYEYFDSSKPEGEQFIKVEFPNVNNQDIWNLLLDNLALENVYTDNGKYRSDYFVKEVEISIDIQELGYKNISIELTDKGYLITNILDTGKGFYIGEEKVQKFIDYLTENYKGYQIVYIDTNQNYNEEKTNPADDKIMIYDIATNTVTEVNMNSIKGENNSLSSSVNYTEAFDPTKK